MATKNTRVSPGVYRDSKGNLTNSPTSKPAAGKAAPKAGAGIGKFEQDQQKKKSDTVSVGDPQAEARNRAIAGLFGNEATNASNAIIGQYLPEGVLGRVDTKLQGGEEAIQQKRDLIGKYGQRDPMQTDVLNRMQGGLEGYTAPQYQAQREQMQRGMQSAYANQAGQLAKAQARGKVYGAAGVAQQANLQASNAASRNQLEQDLMVKNIDEQQRRLGEYGNYGRALTQEEYARQSDAAKGFGDEASRQRQEQLDREKTNLGQADAEVASRLGVIQGIGGLGLTKAQNKAANKLQRQATAQLGRR